ncbi:ComEA family DNA-binding protein [Halorhodospira halophila]|uniref:Helix-hairpin-helix DNA-binding, class 1 n=1 Tax=Halorhodospira halophila (strain DSM 244 / SL1) TaxID=349124 RepID=A1WWL6_HALHL|nr:helix-hairpin-helix domain-containing protein [Halorhodospira halophila]ABM62078.1 Helix-hairpin-helix DNA-binding, class 1 [Halorhodospira halophila SL1]MBK1729406.1 DNA-binding protein [Halorhodospira halophila]
MGLFNLGKKDAYGKQRRVEHRGKYLRASRTGGVALRAQARAAGVNLTANTRRGVRASMTPAKNTQVALQNGRFILRGRYGNGPTKLNLSKSGATVSTRNRLGSFNWLKPNRSSAKLFGVQVRGQKAAQLQVFYMLFAAVVGGVQLLLMLIGGLLRGAVALGQWVGDHVHALPRRWRNARLRRQRGRIDEAVEQAINRWDADRLSAAVALAVALWGRGETLKAGWHRVQQRVTQNPGFEALPRSPEVFEEVAAELERCRAAVKLTQDAHRIVLALLAEAATQGMDGGRRAELLFDADDLALARGPRTVLQEELLEIFADHAQLCLEPALPVDTTQRQCGRSRPGRDLSQGLIDLNTASIEELQVIPHIGPERAEAIVAMRPIRRIEQLEEVDGIGPSRLAEIAEQTRV